MIDVFLILIGIAAGVLSGLVGVGGGMIIVPALVMMLGFAQKTAQGTTLAMLLLPVGIFAAAIYYRAGLVNVRAAGWLALGFVAGAYLGARYALHIPSAVLGRIFGAVLVGVGLKLLLIGK
jgi:uncharacterized membrane protein YfcA